MTTTKAKLKKTEARILIYLSVVHNTRKHPRMISHKLQIDYAYLISTLQSMVFKEWIIKHRFGQHVFYDLAMDENGIYKAPLEEARIRLNGEVDLIQSNLLLNNFDQPESKENSIISDPSRGDSNVLL